MRLHDYSPPAIHPPAGRAMPQQPAGLSKRRRHRMTSEERSYSVKETTMTALSQKAAQSQAPPKQKISGA